MKKTKILFISRAYPPVVGGIENQNYELFTWLSRIADVTQIINTQGKKFLPLFLPYAVVRALLLAPRSDVILLGDGVLAVVGWIIKLFYNKPVACVVHGLDLTFPSGIYQKFWVRFFIPRLDKLIAVGNETVRVGIAKGIAHEKLTFIPNGVDTEKNLLPKSRTDLEKVIRQDIRDKKILLTSGRLAKRKGVAWFIRNVMPKLDKHILYVVAGEGPDRENIQQAIKECGLAKRVLLLGYVEDGARNILLNNCDLFLQPNIKIAGDMEGFGISVIEAGACSLPVIAADLEGLKDAIKDGNNGLLVTSGDARAFQEKITALLSDENRRVAFGKKGRAFVIEHFSWEKIARKYLDEVILVINRK